MSYKDACVGSLNVEYISCGLACNAASIHWQKKTLWLSQTDPQSSSASDCTHQCRQHQSLLLWFTSKTGHPHNQTKWKEIVLLPSQHEVKPTGPDNFGPHLPRQWKTERWFLSHDKAHICQSGLSNPQLYFQYFHSSVLLRVFRSIWYEVIFMR